MSSDDAVRAMRLLAWFERFKARAYATDPKVGAHALPVPDFMTSGDVYLQLMASVIDEAEGAMGDD